MREIPKDKIFLYCSFVGVALFLSFILQKCRRTKGRNILYHVIFVILAGVSLKFIPTWVQTEIFSPGGVLVMGTFLPIYEGVVALCTITTTDDRFWLQYFILQTSFSLATEFMDEITARLPQAGKHWYEFEFIVTFWLMNPFTDGACLVFDAFTKPYIVPFVKTIKSKMEGWAQLLNLTVNSSYLWFAWYAFLWMPEEARRFLTIGLGTAYPILGSIVSLSSEGDAMEQQFWLTYWTSYSVLYIMMDYLENFVGHIRGFYSVCALATLYLFLPMFRGAEAVFRRILVPLSGQYENMLLHDAYLVKIGMENSIPKKNRESVLKKASAIFAAKTD